MYLWVHVHSIPQSSPSSGNINQILRGASLHIQMLLRLCLPARQSISSCCVGVCVNVQKRAQRDDLRVGGAFCLEDNKACGCKNFRCYGENYGTFSTEWNSNTHIRTHLPTTHLPIHFTHCAAHRAPPSTRLSACWAVPARGSNRPNSCFSTTASNSACVRASPVSEGHSQYQMSTMRPFEEAVAQKQADSPGDTPQRIPAPREC